MYSPHSPWASPSYLGGDNEKKPAAPVFKIYDPPAWADAARAAAGGVPVTKLRAAAEYQIAKAYIGSRLSDMSQAEDVSLFARSAIDDVGAHYRAAYWIAVAARIVGSRSLAFAADKQAVKATLLGASSFVGKQFVSNVGPIFSDAAATVRSAAGSNGAALAVASKLDALALEAQGAPVQTEAARQTTNPFDDKGVTGIKVAAGIAALALVYYLATRKSAAPATGAP